MFAVTERLLLRPGWIEDAPALTAAIDDREIVRNLARVPWPYALSDAETFLALPVDPMRPRFLICRRDSNAIVGGIGLSGDIEAGRAVLALADASLRLPRIRARHALDNSGSAGVLRKLGFRSTGKKAWTASFARGTMETRLFVREREESAQALAA